MRSELGLAEEVVRNFEQRIELATNEYYGHDNE